MRFYNSNNRNQIVDLTTAIVQGMPSDKGLYMLQFAQSQISRRFGDSLPRLSCAKI